MKHLQDLPPVAAILIAIFVIGGVGLLLETLLVAVARRFDYS